MRQTDAHNTFPQVALPSVHTVEQFGRQWIVKEAEYRRQLQLERAAADEPGPIARTRAGIGTRLIQLGVRLASLSAPAKERSPSAS